MDNKQNDSLKASSRSADCHAVRSARSTICEIANQAPQDPQRKKSPISAASMSIRRRKLRNPQDGRSAPHKKATA